MNEFSYQENFVLEFSLEDGLGNADGVGFMQQAQTVKLFLKHVRKMVIIGLQKEHGTLGLQLKRLVDVSSKNLSRIFYFDVSIEMLRKLLTYVMNELLHLIKT